jgi:hypothetical protein
MVMYRVEVGVLLLGGNGTMGLSRWLRLPFVPFPGLELSGITADAERTETIASVIWSVREGCFFVELMDRADPEESLSGLIDSYGPGWRLHEPGSAPAEEDL